MMKKLALLLALCVLTSCATTAPRYREVTLLDNGNFALTRQSVDAFQSEREVDQRARDYCAQQQRGYQQIDNESSYVNGASGPMHRVTVYFQCPSAEAVPPVTDAAASAAPSAAAVTTPAAASGASTASSSAATGTALATAASAVASASVVGSASAMAEPPPPYREVTALADGRLAITRQSLEPFQSSRAVQSQAQRYCEQRQLHVAELERKTDYVNSSGNEQAHRVTLYFRCQSASAATATALAPQPPFKEVTALGEGRYGITRQSLEPFQSGRAVQVQAERYCSEQQQHVEQIDWQKRYVNHGSNEPEHATTLYFRCTP